MRNTFSEWLVKSPYHWYGRSNLSVSDRKIVDMMRAAFKAGTQSDELDRAAELLRQIRRHHGTDDGFCGECRDDIDAFLKEIEG